MPHCPTCTEELHAPPDNFGEFLGGLAGAVTGLGRNITGAATGQYSNYGLLYCRKCKQKYSVCPVCDTPVRSSNLHIHSKIKCPGCRSDFYVK
jgi:hypothetical protein